MGLFDKKCKCNRTEQFELNGIKYKRCLDCKQEYQYTPVWQWLRVDPGTIEKKCKK